MQESLCCSCVKVYSYNDCTIKLLMLLILIVLYKNYINYISLKHFYTLFWILYLIEPILYKLILAILLFCIKFYCSARVNFGTTTFDLCEADMKDCLPNCSSLQYAHNATTYQHCRVRNIKTGCVSIEKYRPRLLNWFTQNNLFSMQLKQNQWQLRLKRKPVLHSTK